MKKNIFYILSAFLLFMGCKEVVKSPTILNSLPVIYPDYVGVTVPASIAPLNFTIKSEKYDLIDVVITGKNNGILHVQGKEIIQFPESDWHKLLNDNIGSSVKVAVSLKYNGVWKQYKSYPIYVSTYPMDYGLVYRLIAPGYEVYSKMGIYQRDLSTFDQKPIIENTLIPGTCVNCHAFNKNNPNSMSLHLRGAQGATMLLVDGKMELLNTKTDSTMSACVYPYWHPSGKYIAYSVNQTKQGFHEIHNERVEVFDQASDIVVYNLKTNKLTTSHLLRTDALETFPVFSPDGKTLYFCSAKKQDIQTGYKNIKYSLCKIDFNSERGIFGNKVDTLVSSALTGKSVSFPRPSFDGKFLMFTLSDYGNFSIWHREADLYLLTLKTGTFRSIKEVNSAETESFHDWSSNSHWFVFSSRRADGLYTRPYFASIDEKGDVTKPFMLPQQDPRFYDSSLTSYNVPEFVTSKVKVNVREFEDKALKKERKQVVFAMK